MKISPAIFTWACAMLLSVSIAAQAQVLLLNPGLGTGSSTLAGTNPYAVDESSAIWNNGVTTFGASGVLQYADGSTATGVTAVLDGATISGSTGVTDFSTPTGTGNSGSATEGLFFSSLPAKGATWEGTGGTPLGLVAMRVTGLTLNMTYEIYVVAAYVGTNGNARPEGSANPGAQSVFAFAGTTTNALTLNAISGSSSVTGATVSPVSSYQTISNLDDDAWQEGVNYEKFQVTLTAENPTLYILTTGDKRLSGSLGTTTEQRGWLNSVQIVAIPEPGIGAALACGLGLMAFARRRRVDAENLH